jgi:hypothetical protein
MEYNFTLQDLDSGSFGTITKIGRCFEKASDFKFSGSGKNLENLKKRKWLR